MSYDVACFRLLPGADPEMIYGEAMDDDSAGPLDPEVEAAKQRLADLLRAVHPGLEQFAMDYAAVAANEGISLEEVRRRYRNIELDDEESGTQIDIYDWGVSITLPYWHQSGQAEAIFANLWSYLALIQQETGYITYDPQLGRVLSLETDQAAVVAQYCGVSDNLEQMIQGPAAQQKKRPWWKFW